MGFTDALFGAGTAYSADSSQGQELSRSSLESSLRELYNQQLHHMQVQSQPQYHIYRESDIRSVPYNEATEPIINNKKSNKVQEDIDICSRTLR